MGDTFKYLVYVVNIRSRNDMYRRSYVSFSDVCFEIEFIEACYGKLVISLSRIDILIIEVEDMKKNVGDDVSKIDHHNIACT